MSCMPTDVKAQNQRGPNVPNDLAPELRAAKL